MPGQTIGIDLGTANSRVCVFRTGHCEVIRNDHGNINTPSCVAFTDSGILIGDKAKEKNNMDERNRVFSVKRFLGLSYEDVQRQKIQQFLPFDILSICGKSIINVLTKEGEDSFFPEEISGMILKEMKTVAESEMGEKVTGVVITVPTYFNDSQRQATKNAGVIAGLNVLGIINEPTAAAIAFTYKEKERMTVVIVSVGSEGHLKSIKVRSKHHIMIIDFGAGGFAVSVLKVMEQYFEVKGSSSSPNLYGEKLDNLLLAYYIDEIERNYDVDISTNKRALRRLKNACEDAKKCLLSGTGVKVIVDGIADGKDFALYLTPGLFNGICGATLRTATKHVDNALKFAELNKDGIDDILLLGGCGRMPIFQRLLQQHLGKAPKVICANEHVAYGAAIHAARLSRKWHCYSVLDIIPFHLMIEIPDQNVRQNLMEKNQRIPTRIEHTFTTIYDSQKELLFNIFEEGCGDLKIKELLGTCTLSGIPAAPQGESQIRVIFEISLNGILQVSNATERNTGKKIETIFVKGYKTNEELQKMVSKADILSTQSTSEKLRILTKDELERYVYSVKRSVQHCKDDISDEERKFMKSLSTETLEWLEKNQMASKETFDRQLGNLRAKWTPVMTKLHQGGKLLPGECYILGFYATPNPKMEDEYGPLEKEHPANGSGAVAVPNFNAA